jgi:putative FmdB family regulatory protein
MPLFDYACRACGHVEEDEYVPQGAPVPDVLPCPVCSSLMRRGLGDFHLHGILWSGRNGPQASAQMGTTFNSNAEKREFLAGHPEVYELDRGSPDERRFADRTRERAEAAAKRQGFDGLEHRTRVLRAEMAKGWNPQAQRRAPRPR